MPRGDERRHAAKSKRNAKEKGAAGRLGEKRHDSGREAQPMRYIHHEPPRSRVADAIWLTGNGAICQPLRRNLVVQGNSVAI
jgi:hypothetical protein